MVLLRGGEKRRTCEVLFFNGAIRLSLEFFSLHVVFCATSHLHSNWTHFEKETLGEHVRERLRIDWLREGFWWGLEGTGQKSRGSVRDRRNIIAIVRWKRRHLSVYPNPHLPSPSRHQKCHPDEPRILSPCCELIIQEVRWVIPPSECPSLPLCPFWISFCCFIPHFRDLIEISSFPNSCNPPPNDDVLSSSQLLLLRRKWCSVSTSFFLFTSTV